MLNDDDCQYTCSVSRVRFSIASPPTVPSFVFRSNFYRTGAVIGAPTGRGALESLRKEAEYYKVRSNLGVD